MGYEKRGDIEKGYPSIKHILRSPVEDYHCLLPDNYDKDYFIYKATNAFREVSVEDFHRWQYAAYIFFDKKIYDKNHIENWIKWIKVNRLDCRFLDKPFPAFDPNKIKVRNYGLRKKG